MTNQTDLLDIAFVVKGVVTHPRYDDFLETCRGELNGGEVEVIDELIIEAAKALTAATEGFMEHTFDHIVFAYEASEPFGKFIVDTVIKENSIDVLDDLSSLAYGFLDSVAATNAEVIKRTITQDKDFDDPVTMETHYESMGQVAHPIFPVSDWKYEVANGDTREGYWGWVFNKVQNWEPEDGNP